MWINNINTPVASTSSPVVLAARPSDETATESSVLNITTRENEVAESSVESVRAAVQEMNKAIQPKSASIQFELDEDTGRTVVKMIDTDTNEVVLQIPSEEALAISKSLDRLQGLMVHVKA